MLPAPEPSFDCLTTSEANLGAESSIALKVTKSATDRSDHSPVAPGAIGGAEMAREGAVPLASLA